MTSDRELRYYASVPKLLLLLLLFGGMVAIGWWAWATHTSSGALTGALLLGVGGLGALTCLIWLVVAIGFRKPLLTINDIGFITSLPLRPSHGATFRWDKIAGIGIRVQRARRWNVVIMRIHYLALDMREEVDQDAPQAWSKRPAYLWLTDAALVAALDIHFLFDTRTQRQRLLERIETTFAPEISRYGVVVDEPERPL